MDCRLSLGPSLPTSDVNLGKTKVRDVLAKIRDISPANTIENTLIAPNGCSVISVIDIGDPYGAAKTPRISDALGAPIRGGWQCQLSRAGEELDI